MKRNAKLLLILLLAVLLALLIAPHIAAADLGDFGGGDFGGGSDDWIGFACTACVEIGVNEPRLIPFLILAFLIFLAVVEIRVHIRKKKGLIDSYTRFSDVLTIEAYKEKDPNFSEEAVKTKLSNLYFKIVDCRMRRDAAPIRPYLCDELYERLQKEFDGHRAQGVTHCSERVAILDVALRGVARKDGAYKLIAVLETRQTEFTRADADGKILSGSDSTERFVTSEILLTRPVDAQTVTVDAKVQQWHCPNCGAPLSLNESAKCPYCDSVLDFDVSEWKIESIKTIRSIEQKT